ncbi:MAG: hypothetical protein O2897_05125 [bacterium]|nr:hypothetical protein [bacterium]
MSVSKSILLNKSTLQFPVLLLCFILIYLGLGCEADKPIELSKLPSEDKLIFKSRKSNAVKEFQIRDKLTVEIISPISELVREGRTVDVDAKVTFAQGIVVYTWSLLEKNQSYVDTTAHLKFEVPFIETCDVKFTLQVTAVDEMGQTAQDTININVSRVWCSFNASSHDLLSDTITSLALSESGTLWVGTDKGLNSLKKNIWFRSTSSDQFNYVNALAVRKQNSFVEDEILVNFCFAANHKCKGLQRIIDTQNAFKINSGRNSEVVTTLVFDKKGRLFAGTLDSGVNVINFNQNDSIVDQYIRQHNVVAMVVDFYDSNLFGTTSGVFFAGKGLYWQNQKSLKGHWVDESIWREFPKEDITSLARDGSSLYVGFDNQLGQGGLVRMMMQKINGFQTKSWQVYRKSQYPNMSSNDIRHIVAGKKVFLRKGKHKFLRSHIWVATGTGLNRFVPSLSNENSGTWESAQFQSNAVKNRGGLTTNDISVLLYDQNTETLWIGTNGGGLTRLRVGLLE